MDLQTENRIAAIILKEAAELRRQAEKDGVEVYLRQPKVQGRPNSRFLTATVLGVQQANRAVEENEMWRARQKEIELDDRLRGKIRDEGSSGRSSRSIRTESGRSSKRQLDIDTDASSSCSSRKRDDEGLRDDEVEEFLHSRIKRGRGSVGSRMDETGPYLSSCPDTGEKQLVSLDVDRREGPEKHKVLGPAKPSSRGSCESSEEESFLGQKKTKKAGSSKQRSNKHRSMEKSRDKEKEKKKKKKTREEKRRKHHK